MNTTRIDLAPHPSQVRIVSQYLTQACKGMQQELIDVAVLLTSELVTNAIRHGKGVIRLAIKKFPSRLCVEVTDAGTGRPEPQHPGSDRVGGRGLNLVERLASEWGVTLSTPNAGKTVWFTLKTV